MNTRLIVTIDGPAGAGKSTIAAGLARRLRIAFLDTGAMYRAVTWATLQAGIDPADAAAVTKLAQDLVIELSGEIPQSRVWVNGREVTEAIREPAVTTASGHIASNATVREILVTQQRRIAAAAGAIVSEGRDQGTYVFPDADYKFYLDADPAERARRRADQLQAAGQAADAEVIQQEIIQRDQRDQQRPVAPLKKADDAIVIDSTKLNVDQVVETMYGAIVKNG